MQVYQFVWNKNKGSLRVIERDQVWVSHGASSMWGARSVASALMFKEFNQSMVDCQGGAGFRCTAKWTTHTHTRVCVCMLSCSVVSDSLWAHGLYCAYQASLSMEFPRQEYWSGLPFPTPGDLSNPGIEPMSPVPCALADRLPLRHLGSLYIYTYTHTHTHTHTHTQFNQVEFFPGWL